MWECPTFLHEIFLPTFPTSIRKISQIFENINKIVDASYTISTIFPPNTVLIGLTYAPTCHLRYHKNPLKKQQQIFRTAGYLSLYHYQCPRLASMACNLTWKINQLLVDGQERCLGCLASFRQRIHLALKTLDNGGHNFAYILKLNQLSIQLPFSKAWIPSNMDSP